MESFFCCSGSAYSAYFGIREIITMDRKMIRMEKNLSINDRQTIASINNYQEDNLEQ